MSFQRTSSDETMFLLMKLYRYRGMGQYNPKCHLDIYNFININLSWVWWSPFKRKMCYREFSSICHSITQHYFERGYLYIPVISKSVYQYLWHVHFLLLYTKQSFFMEPTANQYQDILKWNFIHHLFLNI